MLPTSWLNCGLKVLCSSIIIRRQTITFSSLSFSSSRNIRERMERRYTLSCSLLGNLWIISKINFRSCCGKNSYETFPCHFSVCAKNNGITLSYSALHFQLWCCIKYFLKSIIFHSAEEHYPYCTLDINPFSAWWCIGYLVHNCQYAGRPGSVNK